MHGIHDDVVFDFEGALSLARQLGTLADQVAALVRARQSLSDAARVGFLGRHADDFVARVAVEVANGSNLAAHLRSDAEICAAAWKKAMDEENRRRYARHVDDIRRQRSIGQTVWDDLFGWKYPPAPEPVPLPRPPLFAPTAELTVHPPVHAGVATARPAVR